jgi:hypothetical protein
MFQDACRWMHRNIGNLLRAFTSHTTLYIPQLFTKNMSLSGTWLTESPSNKELSQILTDVFVPLKLVQCSVGRRLAGTSERVTVCLGHKERYFVGENGIQRSRARDCK